MFWSHGVGYWSYVGIHWDGQGRAGIGVYHNSDTLYESDIEHKVERFTGFTLAAISMSLDRPDFFGSLPDGDLGGLLPQQFDRGQQSWDPAQLLRELITAIRSPMSEHR